MLPNVKQTLLQLLTEHADTYISGQTISDTLGCSRTAIWKHIEDLRQAGYEVEAKARYGYRLTSIPDRITEHEIGLNLNTEFVGKVIHFYDQVESTQPIASELALNGASEGTVVITEHQTAGRGRLQRHWHSNSGRGISMSIIFRPNVSLARIPEFTLIVAVALAKAIKECVGLDARIKWPNDLLINGKKVSGVLTELHAEENQISYIILGIGMNVNQLDDDMSNEIKDIATSLRQETNHMVSRAKLVQVIFHNLENEYKRYLELGFLPIKKDWEEMSCVINQPLVAKTTQGMIEGIGRGITDEGILLLEDSNGKLHSIISGDIFVDMSKK